MHIRALMWLGSFIGFGFCGAEADRSVSHALSSQGIDKNLAKQVRKLMANHALNLCERFFTGDNIADAIGSARSLHGSLD